MLNRVFTIPSFAFSIGSFCSSSFLGPSPPPNPPIYIPCVILAAFLAAAISSFYSAKAFAVASFVSYYSFPSLYFSPSKLCANSLLDLSAADRSERAPKASPFISVTLSLILSTPLKCSTMVSLE